MREWKCPRFVSQQLTFLPILSSVPSLCSRSPGGSAFSCKVRPILTGAKRPLVLDWKPKSSILGDDIVISDSRMAEGYESWSWSCLTDLSYPVVVLWSRSISFTRSTGIGKTPRLPPWGSYSTRDIHTVLPKLWTYCMYLDWTTWKNSQWVGDNPPCRPVRPI